MTKMFSRVVLAGCLLSSLPCAADVELNRCLELNKNSTDRFSICYGQLTQRTLQQKSSDQQNRLEQQAAEDQRVDETAKAAGKILINSLEDEEAAKAAGQLKDSAPEQQAEMDSSSQTTATSPEPIAPSTPAAVASPKLPAPPTQEAAELPKAKESDAESKKPDYPIQYY